MEIEDKREREREREREKWQKFVQFHSISDISFFSLIFLFFPLFISYGWEALTQCRVSMTISSSSLYRGRSIIPLK